MIDNDLGIILAVIIAFGILGNISSFLILLRGKRCRKLFCSAYLMALSFTDTVILALPALELCLFLLTDSNIMLRSINQFMCKFLQFLLYYGEQLSTWIVVGVSFARALGIWFPLRSQAWRNKTALPYLVAITVILFIVDLPFIIDADIYTIAIDENLLEQLNNLFKNINISDLIRNGTFHNRSSRASLESLGNLSLDSNGSTQISTEYSFCLLKDESIYGMGKLLRPIVADICLIFAIPLCIITTCNILIIVKLVQSFRQITANQGGQTNLKESRMVFLALRIFILSTVHLVSTGPISIVEVMKATSVNNFALFALKERSLYRAFNLLFYLNSGANFVLYCLFGNEFRQDLYDMIRFKKKSARKQQEHCKRRQER